MKRRLWMFAALFLAAVVVRPAAQAGSGQQKPAAPEQQPPVFRTEANFVRIDAYPTKDGRPVDGLTADDFEVFEDNVPQKIQSFEHVRIAGGTPPDARMEPGSVREGERMAGNPRARVFVVFLDVPHVQVSGSHAIKEPLIKLLGRLMGADDLVAVMTPAMAPTDMTFGRKTEIIERGLRDNWAWGQRGRLTRDMDERERDYDLCYPDPASMESELARQMKNRRRERMVLDALHDMVRYLGGIREERKAIITVTEGWRLYGPEPSLMAPRGKDDVPGADPIGVGPDGRLRRNPANTRTDNTASKYECDTDRMTLAMMDNERYFRELLDVANRANATFYPVDPRGLAVFDDDITANTLPSVSQTSLRNKHLVLRTLAENTDGIAILDDNNLDRGLRRVSDDLSSYYLLGYYSTNTKLDGRFRSLKVRVKKPGIDVRARRGYLAATAAEVHAARAATPAPAAEGADAVASAIADLMRVRPDASLVLHAVAAGPTAVWVAGEIPAGKESASGGTATIDVIGTGPAATTTGKAELKPGERAFLIRIPLAAPAPQAEVRGRFVRPDSPLPLSFTTRVTAVPRPLLFRRGSSTGNRLVPAANFQFSRTERVRLELPLDATVKPGAGRVLDRTGQALQVPVTISERTDAETGQRWLVADVALAALGMGDYAVEIAAGDTKVLTGVRVAR